MGVLTNFPECFHASNTKHREKEEYIISIINKKCGLHHFLIRFLEIY